MFLPVFSTLADYVSCQSRCRFRTIEKKWKGLTNALGGLFCSSLNKLDDKKTVSPTETFTPTNPRSHGQPFFHALLPLERPCTENLTPFISLLPCRAAAGLAELLNPHKLFDANWQRLIVHVVKDVESAALTIKLSMEVVQDPVRTTLSAGSQRRRGETQVSQPECYCDQADRSVHLQTGHSRTSSAALSDGPAR